jgi:hypothetical protein
MAGKVRNISVLVNDQLPEFITTEYPKLVSFLSKYYEQLELPGQPLNLIQNLTKYNDIDTYNREILQESTILTANVSETSNSIEVESTESFPKVNGYILINDEVIFYKEKTETEFLDCYRNVSGTTKLGDLYEKSTIKTVDYQDLDSGEYHTSNTIVYNVSNLFLYAFVKNFESQYLTSFPEENLKPQVDKKTLIKNIKNFYKAKGTEQSIKFIFNSIVSQNESDVPSVYYPKDFTFKSSSGEWVSKYALKVKVLSGDISKIIGERIVQYPDSNDVLASNIFAVVDNVIDIGDNFYEVILAPETVIGEFRVASETVLTKNLPGNFTENKKINVFSTAGWQGESGKLLIGDEEILFKNRNINQFVIAKRGQNPQSYLEGEKVYNFSSVESEYIDENGNNQTIKLLILGVIYDFSIDEAFPYSSENDRVQESSTGFESREPVIYDVLSGQTRWKINENLTSPVSSSNSSLTNSLADVNSDVSAVFEDDQYYYIASSSFPSHNFAKNNWRSDLEDQKLLRLIKKSPSNTTEIYKTPTRDVGISVNGTPFYSYKENDSEDVIFGGLTEIVVTDKGKGYQAPPYVLIEEKIGVETAKAKTILAGEVVDSIVLENSGTGYFPPEPIITITSGRGAVVEALVTLGKVTSLKIVNPGEYYSSPPIVEIVDREGRGRFARYRSTVSNDGKITGFIKEDEGKFYTQRNIEVRIIPVGSGAKAFAKVRRWKKDRFALLKNNLDSSNGYYFRNINIALGYGYGYVGNPIELRKLISDNITQNGETPSTLAHSPILGFAYDGNPIYGPYGYSNPKDSNSSISRMSSSYSLKTSRFSGPPTSSFVLGTFIEDYEYNHRSGSLDQNNGRFCITPEYPNGTYAYFITVDENNLPKFPYILGDNYYSLPVDSNYTKSITQLDVPLSSTRLKTENITDNGSESTAFINEVNSGTISAVNVVSSHNNFSVGSFVEVDYADSDGEDLISRVSSIKGKEVLSLENRESKAIQIDTESFIYLFEGDTLFQENTNAYGEIIGNIFDGKSVVLRDVQGEFNAIDKIFSSTRVLNIIVDKISSFTAGSTLILTNGKQTIVRSVTNNTVNVSNNPLANGESIIFSNNFSNVEANKIYYVRNRSINSFQISDSITGPILTLNDDDSLAAIAISEKGRGEILETTEERNNIRIRLIQGEFSFDNNFFLISSTRTDTPGVRVSQVNELSKDINIFRINDNIAIATTDEEHNLAEGDTVNVEITPDDDLTETTYYVRRRIYQKVKFNVPVFESKISDTGIGTIRTLNSGGQYANNGNANIADVELIFADQTKCRDSEGRIVGNTNKAVIGNVGGENNAKATFNILNGLVVSITVTNKGKGYKRGDILTVSNQSLNKIPNSLAQSFVAEVEHVGLAFNQTILSLRTVDNLSNNDLLKIGKEVVKVVSVSKNTLSAVIERGIENTVPTDHYNNQDVVLYQPFYRLSTGYEVGRTANSAIIENYDAVTQEATLVFNVSETLQTISSIGLNTTFFDQSTPKKLVSVTQILEKANYYFEISLDNQLWNRNPIINIQKYYRYKFDTSHPSLIGSFLEFSPSGNFNIETLSSFNSAIIPGYAGAFSIIKVGFEKYISSDFVGDKEKVTQYTNYFYYDKSGIINSENSYLKLTEDPLQGDKIITFVTPTKFVYQLSNIAEYDGTGDITYITSSSTAIGEIDSISIANPGKNFSKLPFIKGIRPTSQYESIVEANWNQIFGNIESVSVILSGRNYSIPKAIVIDGDGTSAEFDVIKNTDGSISAILVKNKGKNYSYKPLIKIIESDVEAYYESNTIGTPKSIRIIKNGTGFNRDLTISRKYSSCEILILKDFVKDGFLIGEEILQIEENTITAKGFVKEWRTGSNVLKVESVEGIFKLNVPILGRTKNNTANIVRKFATAFIPKINSYYDNLGKYSSERSRIGSESQRITDSFFYQDYSYVIKSKTSVESWRNLIKKTVHPAGFNVFGEVEIDTEGANTIPPSEQQPTTSSISFVQLWNPEKNKVTIESTRRTITQSSIRVKDINEQRAKGSVYISPFDTSETISYEFYLTPEFDGYIDEFGNRNGTKSFVIRLKGSNSVFNIENQYNTFITLDGILQEPGKAYSIDGPMLTFSQAPLGKRYSDGSFGNDSLTAVNPVSFYNIKLNSITGQLDTTKFVVNQIFNTSPSSPRRVRFFDSTGFDSPELSGTYKVIDKGVDGFKYNVVSFTNNVGPNTATLVLENTIGLTSNSAGLAISGNGISETSAVQGVDLQNNIITISGFVTVGEVGTVTIGNRYITLKPQEKLLPVLESVYSEDILSGTAFFTSSISLTGYSANTKAYFEDYSVRNYIAGVDTPAQYLIGRIVKLKDATLNNQKFRKIKDISNQFDNIKTVFDLYYEDNSPVVLESSENLIVSIDGVAQRAGFTPFLPFDRAYYIRRTVTPNQIVFVEPPRKFSENIEDEIFNENNQKFFAYSIGAYERLSIDEQYIDDAFRGPFILRSSVSDKTIPIDDDRNVFVFIDGVLQRRNSYTIRGANITFSEPIRIGQKVNILYLYGRDGVSFITLFNFENISYYNRIEMEINYVPDLKQYNNLISYQGTDISNNTAIGLLKKFDVRSQTKTILTFDTQNKKFVTGEDITIIDGRSDGLGDFIIPGNSIILIGQNVNVTGGSVYFEETEETLDILKRDNTGWLIGSSIRPNYYNSIDVDDLIRVDGENDYRKITSIPDEVIKTQYREIDDVNTDYLGKLTTTNYNGIQLGEGLDIFANIDTDFSSPSYGQITSLTWNKKDYDSFVTKQILPRPAGYGYEDAPRLHFVPQALKDEGGSIISPAQGGGAQGYVVVHNGEPIDVVLTNTGSEYLTAPKIYIARGFNIRKSNKNIVHRKITQFFTPLLDSTTLRVTSGDLLLSQRSPEVYIETSFSVPITTSDIVITAELQLHRFNRIPQVQRQPEIISIINAAPVQVRTIRILTAEVFGSSAPPFEQVAAQSTVTLNSVKKETLLDIRSFLKVLNKEAYPSVHDTGSYLEIPLDKNDTIVYVSDTSKFTVSGRLMINGEILRYSSKLSDRFLNVLRAQDGTSAREHDAGSFVRQYRENVTIVPPVGVASVTSVTSEVGVVTIGSAQVADIISVIQKEVRNDIDNITQQRELIIQDVVKTNSIVSVIGVGLPLISVSVSSQSVSIENGQVADIVSTIQKEIINDVGVLEERQLIIQDVLNTNSIIDVISAGVPTYNISSIISVDVFDSKIENITIISPSVENVTTSLELSVVFSVEKQYKTGFIDYYQENVALSNIVVLRDKSELQLDDPINVVILRNGSPFLVDNKSVSLDNTSLVSYYIGNVGNNIGTFNSWAFVNTGLLPNSGTSIQELELAYPSLRIDDLSNNLSSYIKSGLYWNYAQPSITNPVTNIREITTLINNGTLPVVNTTHYPSSGKLLIIRNHDTSSYTIITYTGKTSNSFTGCSIISGQNTFVIGNEVRADLI